MTALHPRQIDILNIARRKGRVEVESLAEEFNVTPQTIRRNINDLCEMEQLQRVHGGAVYPSSTSNFTYNSRREIAKDAKSQIAERAATFVPNDSSLILNIGTTTERVAESLRHHTGLMVVTNNLNVATILAEAADVEVVLTGGMVRKSDLGIIGSAAIDIIKQFKVDIAIVGSSAIDEDGCLLDFDYREVRVSQAILQQARKRILVADNMKFERKAPVQIGHMSEIDVFVTDVPPPPEIIELCMRSGVQLEITNAEFSRDQGHSQNTVNLIDQ